VPSSRPGWQPATDVTSTDDAQITGKCQFRADGKCRTVECRNEDGAACIHLQEGGMEAVKLQKCLEPGHPRERSDNRHSVDESRRARYELGDARVDRRESSATFL
jgi:hypothetical protein